MNVRSHPSVAALACVLIATVWLNQSVGEGDWHELQPRVLSAPTENLFNFIRYPFIFLYRKSHDEEIYFATASALSGRAFPKSYLSRGEKTNPFAEVESRDDGIWRAPYSEVPLEYPPLVLPFVILPRLLSTSFRMYAWLFDGLMGLCLVGACAVMLRKLKQTGATAESIGWRWWLLGALLLAHGGIAIQRLDAIVALFLALAVSSATVRRPGWIGLWLGLATATKLLPILLLPLFVVADAEAYRDVRKLAKLGVSFALSTAIGLAPMLLAGPAGVKSVFGYHAARGLQIESTLAVLYAVIARLLGHPVDAINNFGASHLHTDLADSLAKLCLPLTLLAVAALVVLSRPLSAATEARRLERISLIIFAGVAALWLSGKVFSPQYLTWAFPLVLVLPWKEAAYVVGAFFLSLILGQLYLRGYYDEVVHTSWPGIGTVFVRQLLLFLALVWSVQIVRQRGLPVGQEA